MANKLASPTFVSGPTDKLATVDVYKVQQQSGQVVNSVKNLLQTYDPKLASSLSGFNSIDVQNITRAALNQGNPANSQMVGKTLQVGSDLLNRAMQINPEIANTIRSMDSELRNKLSMLAGSTGNAATPIFGQAKNTIGGFGTLGSGTYNLNNPNNYMCTIDGVNSPIPTSNIFQTQQMSGLVNSITGSNSMTFRDSGAEVGLYSSVINQSLDTNITGVTKDVLSVITDRQILGIVAREVLPNVVKYSSLTDLYNLSSNLSRGELLSSVPNLLNIFTSSFGSNQNSSYYYGNYGNNQSYYTSKHIATYSDILKAYNATHPGWNVYSRKTDAGVEQVTDISPLVGGTSTFNSVLTAGATNSANEIEKAYLLAPLISPESVESALQRQYPRTKFYFNNQVQRVVDPRSLSLNQM